MYINQSLSYLEQCVVALSRKSAGHVPYRQSKLTNILKVYGAFMGLLELCSSGRTLDVGSHSGWKKVAA